MQELLDRLKDLSQKFSAVKDKLNLEEKTKNLKSLNTQMEAAGFWDTPEKAQKIAQQASHLEQFIGVWQEIETNIRELPDLISMATESELEEMNDEVNFIEQTFSSKELELLFDGDYDESNAIVSIHVGTGGQDAEEFTLWLERMYLRYAEQQGWKATILEESTSEDGLKSATIHIQGAYAYGYLQAEHGVQRLIRLSPFNAKNLRQTSFAKVEVIPEVEDGGAIDIAAEDIRTDVYRSSGAGGQSVNTTDSAVRITYLPLNIVVTCQNERSQQQNKETAMKILKSKLIQIKAEQQAERLDELRGDKLDANFGSQIRTFTLQPYRMVKDHRTDYEESDPQKVLDGSIGGFIEEWLRR